MSLVSDVLDGGRIAAWNLENPAQKVLIGDGIVQVPSNANDCPMSLVMVVLECHSHVGTNVLATCTRLLKMLESDV